MTKFCLLSLLEFSLALHAAPARQQELADSSLERLVLGTVVAIRPELSLITIRESDLLGRVRVRFKSYQVKQTLLLYRLRPGDKITAAFSSQDGMLHRVRRIRSYRAFAP